MADVKTLNLIDLIKQVDSMNAGIGSYYMEQAAKFGGKDILVIVASGESAQYLKQYVDEYGDEENMWDGTDY